jgi:hypothetical protein
MNSQDFRALQEAYLEVYIPEESMPPRKSKEERAKRAKELGDRQTIRDIVGKYNKEKSPSRKENPDKYYPKEQVDLYDIILSHLLDEGYADTYEAAEKIMVNMSEEWRESICEGRRTSLSALAREKMESGRQETEDQKNRRLRLGRYSPSEYKYKKDEHGNWKNMGRKDGQQD